MESFQLTLNRRLRATGLEGSTAWATVHDGALQLQDAKMNIVRFPADSIARIRIGFVEGKRRVYHLRVWRDTMDKPVEIIPVTGSWSPYRAAMFAFAELLMQHDRLDHIETGSSKFDALLGPMLMMVPCSGAIAVSIFVLTNEPWWGRMIVPLIPTIVLAIFVWVSVRRLWPRPLENLQALRKQLPPA